MEKLFSYNSLEHWEASNKQTILVMRLLGVLMSIGAIGFFVKVYSAEPHWTEIVYSGFVLLFGAVLIIGPDKYFKPKAGVEFLTISQDRIVWSNGRFTKPTELLFADIDAWKKFVGEIQFTTMNGNFLKLQTHKIHDKAKHEEFFRVLKDVLG